jgi:CPA1 family monovalent cation:H+ antiporter
MIVVTEGCLALLGIAGILRVLARKMTVPPPVLMVTTGLLLSFLPRFPRIALDPDLALLFFLPPIVYSAAVGVTWSEFRENLRPVVWLAVGLVLATMVLIAMTAHAIIPGISWPVAFVMGAVISPPDEVAIIAVAERLGIPRPILVALEGEGLVNDATALIAFKFALAAVATHSFSPGKALLDFGAIVVGETCWGVFVGWVASRLRSWAEDSTAEITISFLTPYAAYLPLAHLGGSGVIATVAAGLFTSWQGPLLIPFSTRLRARPFWDTVVFLLDSLLFLLTGLQLQSILRNIYPFSWPQLVGYALLISGVLIAARFGWVFLAALPFQWIRKLFRSADTPWTHSFMIAWSGMRGAISLATALAVPLSVDQGGPSPVRNLIVFLTFAVILTTLVVQGLPLPFLVRRLGLSEDVRSEIRELERQESEARLLSAQAALADLEAWSAEEKIPPEAAEPVKRWYERRIERYRRMREERPTASKSGFGRARKQAHRLLHRALTSERQALLDLRDEGVISETVRSRIERDLDLDETRFH